MPQWPPGWCSPKSPASDGVNVAIARVVAALVLLAVALLAPKASAQPSGFDLQAHRGGRGETTEESLRAFAKSLELGVSTLELDIVITKDGQPLVWHDPTIQPEKCSDTAPAFVGDPQYPYVGKLVHDLTLPQVRALDSDRRLAEFPRVHVVATLPAGQPVGLRAPPNTTVCRFVPHGAVLDRAVCAVTHGGMGATQKALACGVPVCVVPFGRDQFEVARRVEVAGCGTRLAAKKLSPPRLRTKVREAMTMADGAERVAAGFKATGGTVHGADLFEQRVLGLNVG